MKLVLRTVAVLVVAYVCYPVLVMLPAWLPSLPAPPKLPLLDPQSVLSALGMLPEEVSKRIDEARRGAEDLQSRAEDLREEAEAQREAVEEHLRDTTEETRKKVDKERRKREDEAKEALKKLGL